MDETGAYYTEWSKPERKTPIQYINAYIWNLEPVFFASQNVQSTSGMLLFQEKTIISYKDYIDGFIKMSFWKWRSKVFFH